MRVLYPKSARRFLSSRPPVPSPSRSASPPRSGQGKQAWLAAAISTGTIGELGRRHLSKNAVLCEEKKDSDEGSSILPSLPSMPSLPALPSLAELRSKVNLDFDKLSSSILSFRDTISTIHEEISKGPKSMYLEVDAERRDVKMHPEMQWDASVRLGTDLPISERAFMRNRKEAMRDSFATFVGVPVDEVDTRDIPVVSFAGSGGGYRAMVFTLGNLRGAEEIGLWQCVSHISAVSGSCWGISLLYSLGGGSIKDTIEHVSKRITTPFLDNSTWDLLVQKPTNKYLLSGAILKESSKGGEASLVDVYGTLVSSRLFLPADPSTPLDPLNLKISHQRNLIEDGSRPLPIYCSIRHEIPNQDKLETSSKKMKQGKTEKERDRGKEELKAAVELGRYHWFESTPFEFGCDEIGAWIPTWAVGRQFDHGKNVERQPEISLTIMSGVFASAFCATLYSYFKEIKPLIMTLPYYSTMEEWLLGNYQSALDAIHPLPPAELPNYLKGLDGQLRPGSPETLTKIDTLGFMDAGANLNIPYVPLFRRDCDVIIALDASADSQDLWFDRAQEYATARKLKAWPRVQASTLFKAAVEAVDNEKKEGGDENREDSTSSEKAASKVDAAKAQETARGGAEHPPHAEQHFNPNPPPLGSAPRSKESEKEDDIEKKIPSSSPGEPPLGTCSIWIGSTKDEDSNCRMDRPTVEEVCKRDGIALAYIPLLGNEELKKPTEVWSTWKFDYKPEETETLIRLARDNMKASEEQLKMLLRGVWERKKRQRLASQGEDRERA